MESHKESISVSVVNWNDETGQAVSVFLRDLDIAFALTPEGARHLAFLLMECADYMEPPFQDQD
jgi:hypothetical protein